MNKKILFVFLIIILAVLLTGVLLFIQDNGRNRTKDNSSGLIVGKNAIYVSDQMPGSSILVSLVHLEKPGFVVMHEDSKGMPDKILGSSSLLSSGESKNLSPIMLARSSSDGEVLYAMLHLDNGDGKFNEKDDKPALDSLTNQPVMMIILISNDATEPGVINL